MRRSGSRVVIISILLLGVLIFGAVYYVWDAATNIFQPTSTATNAQIVPFEIAAGQTTTQIANNLQAKGLIRNALAFRVWAHVKGLDTHLQAGIYKQLSPSMTISEITDKLLKAQPDAIRVIIPEGWRLEQIAQRFAASDLGPAGNGSFKKADFLLYTEHINKFPDAGKYPLLKQVPAGRSMEGLLFPSSYEVPVMATARDVVDLMLQTMSDTIQANHLDTKAQAQQMNVYTMLTLASIVEREAGTESDRANIASVYWNRVYKQNAETVGLLQADPTVQYARDTQTPPSTYWLPLDDSGAKVAPSSAWNTYVQTGFPPTPICSPGLASLIAAAAPAKTDYYFFLAILNGNGKSVFAKTLAEFTQDEAKYLK